jgi:hypothetical protein
VRSGNIEAVFWLIGVALWIIAVIATALIVTAYVIQSPLLWW